MWPSTDLNVRLIGVKGPSPEYEINSGIFELKVQSNFFVLENRINGASCGSWGVSELWTVPLSILFFVDDNGVAPLDSSKVKVESNIIRFGAFSEVDGHSPSNIATSNIDEASFARSDHLVVNCNMVGLTMLRDVVELWVLWCSCWGLRAGHLVDSLVDQLL